MHLPPILQDIAIIFGAAIPVVGVCHFFKIPSLLGFLFVGIMLGPSTTGLVVSVSEVEILAEIGVICLLFALGIEFSWEKLSAFKRVALLGGGMQMVSTIALITAISVFFVEWNRAVLFGFLVTLSSTAILVKLLQDRQELNTFHGKTIISVLIFQDLAVVPLILLIPLLATHSDGGSSLADFFIHALTLCAAVLVSAKLVLPRIIFYAAGLRTKEMFLVTVIFVGICAAWLTNALGFSLGLGAFIAGLIISESDYNVHALTSIAPFRDIFVGFFFVSVGMLFDIGIIIPYWLELLGLTLLVFALKALVLFGMCSMLKIPWRASWHIILGVAQLGEFSFILAQTGRMNGLMSDLEYQFFLSASILTMALTPLCFFLADLIKQKLSRHPLRSLDPPTETMTDHVIIVGFGITGRLVARGLKMRQIPYAVIEYNLHTVKQMKQRGEPIIFGDALKEETLEHVHATHASTVVVAIPDHVEAIQLTKLLRKLAPDIHIIVRTRVRAENEHLFAAGADEAVPIEFEAGMETLSRCLRSLGDTADQASETCATIRSHRLVSVNPHRHAK